MEYKLNIDENDHAKAILRKLDSMRRDQKYCDLVISVGGKKIHVNRDIMCAASGYFDAMFSLDTIDKQNREADLEHLELLDVEKCIDYIYSGKMSVSVDECEGLLHSASYMQLNELCDKISLFLEDRLSLASFFNIRKLAYKFSLKNLDAACCSFALQKFFKLAKEKEFNTLDKNFVSFLLSSKKSSGQRIEDSKLAVMLRWVKADADDRERYLMELVDCLDTSKLTFGYTRFLVKNEPLCNKFPEFASKLFIGKENRRRGEEIGPPDLSNISEVASSNCLIIFDQTSKLVQLYRPSENKLTPVTSYHSEMHVISACFAACMLKEYLYVFNADMKAFRLNIREKNPTWTRIADISHYSPTRREYSLQCTVHEDFIYIVENKNIKRYKTGGNERWEDVDLDGNLCRWSALIGHEDFVFVIGGYDVMIAGPVNDVKKFSPSSSAWVSVKSMNVARSSPGVTALDGKIYVAGGFGRNMRKLINFEMFDIESDVWTILKRMKSPQWVPGLQLVDDQIFAVSSVDGVTSIEVYDLKKRRWFIHDNGPKMRVCGSATTAAYFS